MRSVRLDRRRCSSRSHALAAPMTRSPSATAGARTTRTSPPAGIPRGGVMERTDICNGCEGPWQGCWECPMFRGRREFCAPRGFHRGVTNAHVACDSARGAHSSTIAKGLIRAMRDMGSSCDVGSISRQCARISRQFQIRKNLVHASRTRRRGTSSFECISWAVEASSRRRPIWPRRAAFSPSRGGG